MNLEENLVFDTTCNNHLPPTNTYHRCLTLKRNYIGTLLEVGT